MSSSTQLEKIACSLRLRQRQRQRQGARPRRNSIDNQIRDSRVDAEDEGPGDDRIELEVRCDDMVVVPVPKAHQVNWSAGK